MHGHQLPHPAGRRGPGTLTRADGASVSGTWKMTLPLGLQKDAAFVPENNPVSDDAVKQAYEQMKEGLGNKEYNVRHILVKTEAEAKSVAAKLKKGGKSGDFDKLAKELTDKLKANSILQITKKV